MQLISYIKSKQFIKTIVIMLLSVIVGIFLLNFLLNYSTNHNQKIPVPNLTKMTLTEAKEILNSLNLNYEVQDSSSYNPEYLPKAVISHDPEFGEFVKENRKIYLTLNASSYRKIPIPDVLGKTKRQVVTHLTSVGFKIGEFSYIPDIGKDVVRKMTHNGKVLNPGDMIPKMSVIDLVLGDGKN
ncbi:PASTA domain-containing protein [Flavobacteriaceae bacterium F08102]|nr:PASTA domain-containing protein [Flavobacteriaceae bacterium F08102]